MSPREVQEHLTISGYTARIRGDEVQLRECLRCGNDKWNFELSAAKGIWSTWCCRTSGRLDELLKDLTGNTYYIPVKLKKRSAYELHVAPQDLEVDRIPAGEVPSALHYLQQRGLSTFDIKRYNLSVCTDKDHKLSGRILFPLLEYWTQTCYGYLGRSYTSRRPKYLTNAKIKPICGYRLKESWRPVVLVEGFFDGINVHRAGYQAAVLAGVSAPSIREFVARIPSQIPLLILLDGEAKEEAKVLWWTISEIRNSTLINLPEGIDPGGLHPKVLGKLIQDQL